MAGSLANATETLGLNFIFNATTATRPTSWYIGLFSDTAGTSTDQPSTELTSGTATSYARQSITFGAASSGSITNNLAATFTAGGTWPAANYFGIFDASTSGNMLAWGTMTTQTLLNTNQLTWAIGSVVINLD